MSLCFEKLVRINYRYGRMCCVRERCRSIVRNDLKQKGRPYDEYIQI